MAMLKKKNSTNSGIIAGLSEVLRERRNDRGLSQSELAARADVHRTYISELERASQNLTLETLSKLAEALDTTVLSLIDAADQVARKTIEPIEILLAEDNDADVHLIRRALAKINLSFNLHVTADGKETMDFLLRTGKFESAPIPELIFLDLNLPKKSGFEILAEIKANEDLKRIPIVVLTNSSSEKDVERSYGLHANCFITKPASQKLFQEAVGKVVDYWFGVAKIPG